MDRNFDIEDSTDWLETPLSAFMPLEAALRCQVCKDFFDTPMITSCSHTFCSICIRRCLASDGKCPACRSGDDGNRLRRNWAIQEVVDSFKSARPLALEIARRETEARKEEATSSTREKRRRGVKRKIEDTDIEDGAEDGSRRRSGRTTRSQAKKSAPSSQADIIDLDSDSAGDDYRPSPRSPKDPEDGLVPCPMCGKRMKEETVFPHLDRCEDEQKQAPSNPSKRHPRSNQPLPVHAAPQRPSSSAPILQRLPQLNYSLIKDNALRKKLSELGIPTWGSKQLMIRRHIEWLNLWNSNCDSTRPHSKTELLRELDSWERSQGGHAREPSGGVSSVMRKDFDGKGWAHNNSAQFEDLIAKARAKRKVPQEEDRSVVTTTEEAQTDDPKRDTDGDIAMSSHTPPKNSKDPAPTSTTSEAQDAQTTSAAPIIPNVAALTSIRAKVDAANHGVRNQEPIEDPITRIREVADTHNPPMVKMTPTPPLPHGDTPERHSETPTRKVPMFALPEEPVRDVDTENTTM